MRLRVGLAVAVAAAGLVACAPELPINDGRIRTSPLATSSGTVSASAPASQPASRSGTPTPEIDACLAMAQSLTDGERVGQLYMMGVSTAGIDETTRAAIVDNSLGSVVLLGNTTSGAGATRMLTAQLGSLGTAELPLLISVDQEGGSVQRLQGHGFTRIPTARDQGMLAPGELEREAATWGQELHGAGVLYNLAPVGDVVPVERRNTNAPIGRLKRDFGSEPDLVAAKVQEFIAGMNEAGVLTSVKHFPGLGQVTTNTDFGVAIDTEVSADSPTLGPFRAAIDAGVDSVMVSSAIFTLIDEENPGVFSGKVITDLLRDDLGYDGVVIADDLGAAKAVADIEPSQRGVRFIAAGGDIAINADPGLMRGMVEATLERVEEDEAFAEKVTASAARVLELKQSAGLLSCA